MAVYGSLRTSAARIGNSSAVSLLDETLQQEKDADHKLTQIDEESVNREAAGASA